MAPQIRIRSDFPNAVDKQLIEQVCGHRGCRHAYVKPFDRFGFSGAHLLLVYFNAEPIGVPYLLKIARFGKAQREHKGTRVLKSDVDDANSVEDHLFSAIDQSGRKWGALLYIYHGQGKRQGAEVTQALRKLIYDAEFSSTRIGRILKQVFDGLKDAHSRREPEQVPIRQHFERYFRDDAAQARIRCVLGKDADAKSPMFLGSRIYNPLHHLNNLPKHANLYVAPVHGDLHPDNIVIDRNRVAHLIDFAWAHKSRDVLIDYVLLETSIRFMAFALAGAINLWDQLDVDRLLLDEDGFSRIQSIRFSSPFRRDDYSRLGYVVGVIRKRARALIGDRFSMQGYLLTQFILLYGLLRYDDYEPYVATRALGLIAARLRKIGLPAS